MTSQNKLNIIFGEGKVKVQGLIYEVINNFDGFFQLLYKAAKTRVVEKT